MDAEGRGKEGDMQNSKISWTRHTFNPWRGCTRVSAGCDNCYAEAMSKRNPGVLGVWGPAGTRVVAAESQWQQPIKWNRAAKAAGERHRVFCASLADVFEDWRGMIVGPSGGRVTVTASDEWKETQFNRVGDAVLFGGDIERAFTWLTMSAIRERLFDMMLATPELDWLLLTKRPENVRGMVPAGWLKDWPSNVWLGTTVENQARAEERVPILASIPAKVRFLSVEPMLGPVDLSGLCMTWCQACDYVKAVLRDDRWYCPNPNCEDSEVTWQPGIDWVICGGESGSHARPMHPDWARGLRDQCVAAGVPFFFKQWGDWAITERLQSPNFPAAKTAFVDGRALNVATMKWSLRGLRVETAGSDWYEFMMRMGKERAGRVLDGRTWDEVPG